MFSIGLMSGTSMDGIDAVLCQHKKSQDQTLAHIKLSYPKAIEKELRARVFHYDENLGRNGPRRGFVITNWFEI
jgi:1,6-anhydro-N-acetylmuramate kinase